MSEWHKLGVRARKLGERLLLDTPSEFANFTFDQLIVQRNCGESTIREIDFYLSSIGRKLRTIDSDSWPRPIPVSEWLPVRDKRVICWRGYWASGFVRGDKWWVDGHKDRWVRDVTHWLPLPPAPDATQPQPEPRE